jgi:hypothetical protein
MIENPQTGLLKNQTFMLDIPYNDLDYCKYGMPYRKRTRLWNNIHCWEPRDLCKHDCPASSGKKHKEIAQRGPRPGNNTNRHTHLQNTAKLNTKRTQQLNTEKATTSTSNGRVQVKIPLVWLYQTS